MCYTLDGEVKNKVVETSKMGNLSDFLNIDKALDGITVHWEHVSWYSGLFGNEEAHRLPNEGASKDIFK